MALWLVLLLAAAGTCAPPRTIPLTFENFAIKDNTGRIVAQLDGGAAGGALGAGAWTDCRREGDGLEECWTRAGRKVRVQLADHDCLTITNTWEKDDEGLSMSQCHWLNGSQWFGGGEEIPQKWPLNKYQGLKHSMVTQESANRGIQDPFWFSSSGDLVYVWPGAPLFLSVNDTDSPRQFCLNAEVKKPYRRRPNGFELKTTNCLLGNAKEAYQYAVENFLGKPTGYPDETMIRHPVWSTWARYKADIDEPIVREFARQIKEYGFNNSQLEIDDNWETCYGSKEVNTSRFPDMKKLTDDLRADGFRVTIWTHPFIQQDCYTTLNEASAQGFLVLDEAGRAATHWWNGNASIVDFTKPAAQDWFVRRHQDMMKANGIDGFKFDAGETSWMPQLPRLDTIPPARDEDYPNLATKMYVETCARFNSLTEVRSAYRSQKLPVFVRMIDKDSRWGDDNGLKSLVTTLLQMNMVGYPLVLPDMVGGNQYNGEVATSELFIRWLQANTFMPAIQFSLVPWDYTRDKDQTVAISKTFTELHAKYTDVIVAAMKQSVVAGTPVNAPIWWLDPTDETALQEDSEFLLGESLLSAPVLEKGATKRDVYLPKGSWVDGNTCKKYTGPTTIKDYPAPLNTLPWFYIEGSIADKGCSPGPAPSAAPALASPTRSLTLAVVGALLALLAKL